MFELTKDEVLKLAELRARDTVYDAVQELWRLREDSGWTQRQLAEALGRDPAWVSRALSGPANWTVRTIGEMVEVLDGILEVKVFPRETYQDTHNYDIYDDWKSNCTPMEQVPIVKEGNTSVWITLPTARPNIGL